MNIPSLPVMYQYQQRCPDAEDAQYAGTKSLRTLYSFGYPPTRTVEVCRVPTGQSLAISCKIPVGILYRSIQVATGVEETTVKRWRECSVPNGGEKGCSGE
jgi:hypothetical protein